MKAKAMSLCLCAMLLTIFAAPCACASDLNSGFSKDEFMAIYNSEWKLFNLNYRLFAAINSDFETYPATMMPGTKSFQLAFNHDDVIRKILASIFRKFHAGYVVFLRAFLRSLDEAVQRKNQNFSPQQTSRSMAFNDFIGLYYKCEERMLANVWDKLHERIKSRLSTPFLSFACLIIGAVIFMLRGRAAKMLGKASSETKVKTVKNAVGVAGIICFIAGVIFVSRGLFFTQLTVREFINEQTKLFYTSELPELYWEAVGEHLEQR